MVADISRFGKNTHLIGIKLLGAPWISSFSDKTKKIGHSASAFIPYIKGIQYLSQLEIENINR
jgi:hypothetical protein